MPVVLAVMLGVVKVNDPIAPDPDDSPTEVVPVIVPAPVMVPDPVAVMVSAVPEMFAPITTPELVPLATSPSVPVAVIVLVSDIAADAAAVSVRLKLTPVDAPLAVIAVVSVSVTLPVELTVRLDALRLFVLVKLIPPVPAVRLAVPAASAPLAVMPPAELEAFIVNEEAELAAKETTPA